PERSRCTRSPNLNRRLRCSRSSDPFDSPRPRLTLKETGVWLGPRRNPARGMPRARGGSMESLSVAEDRELLDAYSRAVIEVVERVSPAVVSLSMHSSGVRASGGSGVIFTPDGYLLTNAHVVGDTRAVLVVTSEGETRAGDVVGRDRPTDLAVVHVDVP